MSSNICSTARAAERSSLAPKGVAPAAGTAPPAMLERSPMVSDLLHGQAHNARRNVAGDFDFADLKRQHEVDRSCYGLLVGREAAEDFLGPAFYVWQRPVSFHGFSDPSCGLRCADAAVARDGRSGDHAPGNGLTVQELRVSGRSFQRVPDGVPKIQDTSEIGFSFIGGDDGRLHT